MSFSMRDRDDLYDEYLLCYRNGKDLNRLKSEDETFQVFRFKKGLPVKYISTKSLEGLPLDDQLIGKDGFYMKQKGFYLVPNDFEGRVISFVIRGLTHDYHDFPCMSNIKPLFGWYGFTNFKKGYPIIITEGTKDSIILQQYYPYTLATLTAGITVMNMNILKSMTNKIILAYDKDKTGLKETEVDISKLRKLGIQVQVIHSKGKDFGSDYKNSNYIKDLIKDKINKFSSLQCIGD